MAVAALSIGELIERLWGFRDGATAALEELPDESPACERLRHLVAELDALIERAEDIGDAAIVATRETESEDTVPWQDVKKRLAL